MIDLRGVRLVGTAWPDGIDGWKLDLEFVVPEVSEEIAAEGFEECAECAASPVLCAACLARRDGANG
jgi:hypothetical protein